MDGTSAAHAPGQSSFEDVKTQISTILRQRGDFDRIKAEVRASVFAAIESVGREYGIAPSRRKLLDLISDARGRIAFELVCEFLQFFDLTSTLRVLAAETSMNREVFVNRACVRQGAHVDDRIEDVDDATTPVLFDVVCKIEEEVDHVGRNGRPTTAGKRDAYDSPLKKGSKENDDGSEWSDTETTSQSLQSHGDDVASDGRSYELSHYDGTATITHKPRGPTAQDSPPQDHRVASAPASGHIPIHKDDLEGETSEGSIPELGSQSQDDDVIHFDAASTSSSEQVDAVETLSPPQRGGQAMLKQKQHDAGGFETSEDESEHETSRARTTAPSVDTTSVGSEGSTVDVPLRTLGDLDGVLHYEVSPRSKKHVGRKG